MTIKINVEISYGTTIDSAVREMLALANRTNVTVSAQYGEGTLCASPGDSVEGIAATWKEPRVKRGHRTGMKDGERRVMQGPKGSREMVKVEAFRLDSETPFVVLSGTQIDGEIHLTDVAADDLVDKIKRALDMLPTSKRCDSSSVSLST